MPVDYGFGPRIDGTPKGPGFAAQTLPNGDVMTEWSLGPPQELYPAVYQGITPWDMQTLANVAMYGYDPLANEVYDRAYQSYLVRAMQGLPAFWTPQDGQSGVNMTNRQGQSVQAYPMDAWGNPVPNLYGYQMRNNLFPGEDDFFKQNPTVAGMAAEDGKVILNPYSSNSSEQQKAVAQNEALRLFMRDQQIVPNFELTDAQRQSFEGTAYGHDDSALRQTIVARYLTGDSSAGSVTPEQRKEANRISNLAGR